MKKPDEVGRPQIIADTIEHSWMSKNVEIPLYPELIKIITKRYWTVSELGKQEALENVANGL